MKTTESKSKLSTIQQHRLLQAARLTAAAYERLLLVQACEGPLHELDSATADYNMDASHFKQLRAARGFLPGDRIRIVYDNELKGSEGVVTDWLDQGVGMQLIVDWPEDSPCQGLSSCAPRPTEVELVKVES